MISKYEDFKFKSVCVTEHHLRIQHNVLSFISHTNSNTCKMQVNDIKINLICIDHQTINDPHDE